VSVVQSSHSIDVLKKEFDELLEYLASLLKKENSNTNILNTKLGSIRKDLDDFENLSSYDQTKLVEIVIKYNQVNHIFNNDIDFNAKDLLKIIKGKHEYNLDSNAQYNDFIFEISMATRFLLSTQSNAHINLDGDCDVIVDNMAIECKYIHSRKNLMKNISKAKEQIEKRVRDEQAKFGLIALDLTHICPIDKINAFVKSTFNLFAPNHEKIILKQRMDKGVVESVIDDKNFSKIIQSYVMHEVETALYSELKFDYDMGERTLGIIFQINNSFCVEYKGQIVPIPGRGLTYRLNSRLSKDHYIMIEEYVHKLAVGI